MGETLPLIFKRWKKLDKDFFKKKPQTFNTSKIPDIKDSFLFDILHNRSLINIDRQILLEKISLLSEFVVPYEQGITVDQKVKIGTKIASSLLRKIQDDLLWWTMGQSSTPLQAKERKTSIEENTFSDCRLDETRNKGLVKSPWRHVKTRLYFTSASHLYTLFNTLNLGLDSMLIDNSNKEILEALEQINALNYLSHIVFRLFEDFSVKIVE